MVKCSGRVQAGVAVQDMVDAPEFWHEQGGGFNGGVILWKKGLWWYNAKSSREFTVGDDVKIIAEWHVTLRTNWDALPANDPRRNQGPFCIEYLALKDHSGKPLVDYQGDKSPLRQSTQLEKRARRESNGSDSGSGSEERRKGNHRQLLR